MITGFATAEGTARLQNRHKNLLYRNFDQLKISGIGLGTYLGNHDDQDDKLYEESIALAVEQGCNLIDTAINYRCMRSERAIGKALRQLINKKKIRRDEIVVCTKGGFIPFDGQPPADIRRYFNESFVQKGLCQTDQIAAGCHCMEPVYLKNQISKSLENLGLGTIDLYYLHNPETQLEKLPSEEFYKKLEKAFETLEEAVQEGKVIRYGLATWEGLRRKNSISMGESLEIAKRVAANQHHFRAVQLPFNLAMIEAYGEPVQKIGNESFTPLEAAMKLGLAAFSSASILQGKILGNLPDSLQTHFPQSKSDAQRALQFVISTPGITSALIGMKNRKHVEENLECLSYPVLEEVTFRTLFQG